MKQNIKITIGQREFPLSIDLDDEQNIREAASRVSYDVNQIVSHYGNVDFEQAACIVLLSREIKLAELKLRNKEGVNNILQELQSLDEKLGDYLSR